MDITRNTLVLPMFWMASYLATRPQAHHFLFAEFASTIPYQLNKNNARQEDGAIFLIIL
jgi:hypothetical protein